MVCNSQLSQVVSDLCPQRSQASWESKISVTLRNHNQFHVLDVPEHRVWPSSRQRPRNDRSNGPSKEEVCDSRIHLVRREKVRRAHDTPNVARSSENLRARASEAILLMRGADIRDVLKHPRLDTKLYCSCDRSRDDLRREECSRRHLHVMTKFEV